MEELTISVAKFCRIYGLGKTKTYDLINQGRLEVCRVDRRTLIFVASAKALIKPTQKKGAK